MFIELTHSQYKEKIAIKIDSICQMLYMGNHTLIYTVDGKETEVSESYEDILKALQRKRALNDLASMLHPISQPTRR